MGCGNFPKGDLPKIYNALRIVYPEGLCRHQRGDRRSLIIEVQSDLGKQARVRLPCYGLYRRVYREVWKLLIRKNPIMMPVGEKKTLGRMF